MDSHPEISHSSEMFGDVDHPMVFQDAPTSCVFCHFYTADVRYFPPSSIGPAGSECVCEVCQKLTCLPNIQSPPTDKEPFMQNSSNADYGLNDGGAIDSGAIDGGALQNSASDNSALARSTHQAAHRRPSNLAKKPLNASEYPQPSKPARFASISESATELQANLRARDADWPNVYDQVLPRTSSQTVDTQQQFEALQLDGSQTPALHQMELLLRRQQVTSPASRVPNRRSTDDDRRADNRSTGRTNRQSANAYRPKTKPAPVDSTYVVPNRDRSGLLDTFTASISFATLIILFAIGLSLSVLLAAPSAALALQLRVLITPLVQSLVVTIAFGSAIAFMLELFQ